jgi:hypothetical protein
LSNEIVDLDTEISDLRLTILRAENAADADAYFNPELKNDHQRKSHRHEILEANEDYQAAIAHLAHLNRHRAIILVGLEKLRNEFSVCKLMLRQEIAQTLTAVESREVAGV